MQDTGNLFQNLWQGVQYRAGRLFSSGRSKFGINALSATLLKHRPYNKPGTIRLLGRQVHYLNGLEVLHSVDEIFAEEIYRQQFNTDSPYILDCGSHIGLAVLYYKTQWPGAEVVAFEPDAGNYSILQKNISGFQGVTAFQKAIWKEETELTFQSEGTMGSKIGSGADNGKSVSVQTVRLKDLLVRPIDFLKLDIEGAEYEVLMDCGNSIGYIKNLFIEYHGSFAQNGQLNQIFDLVVKNGFSYYIKEATSVYEHPFVPEGVKEHDVQLNIFCRKTG